MVALLNPFFNMIKTRSIIPQNSASNELQFCPSSGWILWFSCYPCHELVHLLLLALCYSSPLHQWKVNFHIPWESFGLLVQRKRFRDILICLKLTWSALKNFNNGISCSCNILKINFFYLFFRFSIGSSQNDYLVYEKKTKMRDYFGT